VRGEDEGHGRVLDHGLGRDGEVRVAREGTAAGVGGDGRAELLDVDGERETQPLRHNGDAVQHVQTHPGGGGLLGSPVQRAAVLVRAVDPDDDGAGRLLAHLDLLVKVENGTPAGAGQGCPAVGSRGGVACITMGPMTSNVYRVTEIVGTSTQSVDEAVRNGVERAAKTLHNLDWFEVTEIRGHIEEG